MSKKILSLALVVVMLFSMFAITSNAELSSGQVGLYLTTNATEDTLKGETIWVKLYIDVPEAMNFAYNNITIAWNSAAYKPACTNQTKVNDAIEMGSSYADTMKGVDAVSHTTTAGKGALLEADKTAYGWDSAVQFQLAGPGNGYTSTTGFPVEPGYSEILTMYFETQKDLDAADIIGFPMAAYNTKSQFKLQTMERNNTGSKANVAVANLVVVNAAPAAPTAPTYDVYKLADSKKHATGDSFTTASFFAFKDIDPKFDAANKSEHIESITATITANGNPVAAEDIPVIRFVYDLGEGEYGFRVILKNVAANAEISITPVLNTDDGTTYSAETITFNVADVEAV